ncbi:hypothetical protein Pst134EB_006052 [Puccinia striiformis f. sp. tritici]|nr:hypothetical protein Pst134EB_006052 [Puccinia striiformis f. sp. tritici]
MRIVRGIITLDSLGTLVHLAHLQVVLPCQPNLAECTHGHKLQLELLHNLFCWYQDLYYQLSTNPTPFSTDDFVQRLGAQRFPILTNLDISMHMGTPGRLDYIEGIGPTVKRLGGKSGPILIELIGEAGRRYQQILKPEDLRQDALVMQLHRLASMALHNNESTRKWGLQVNQWFELLLQDLNFRSKGRWKKKNNLVIFEGILKVALEAICKRADGIMEILKIITFNCPKPIDEAFKHTQSTRTPEEFRDQLLQAIDACLIDKTTIEERTSKLV